MLILQDPTLLRQANYIGGAWVQADSGATLKVLNPSTGVLVGEVPARPLLPCDTWVVAVRSRPPGW